MAAIFLDCLDEMTALWQAVQRPGDPAIKLNYCPGQPEDVPGLIAGYDIVIVDHTYFDADLLARCPDLRRIVFLGTGAASFIDLAAAEKQGVAVDTIKGYGDTTVAEHTIALMMASARGIAKLHGEMKAKAPWRQIEGVQLLNKKLGVIGMGGIGKEVARMGAGLGMEVLAWNRTLQPDCPHKTPSLDEVLAESDVLCLCLLLNDGTRGFLDMEKLSKTKKGVIFVNTARAAIVDQAALVELLKSGHIRHAGIDVFMQEPPSPEDPLLALDNVTLTSHTGFMTPEATMTMLRRAIDLTIAGGG